MKVCQCRQIMRLFPGIQKQLGKLHPVIHIMWTTRPFPGRYTASRCFSEDSIVTAKFKQIWIFTFSVKQTHGEALHKMERYFSRYWNHKQRRLFLCLMGKWQCWIWWELRDKRNCKNWPKGPFDILYVQNETHAVTFCNVIGFHKCYQKLILILIYCSNKA